MSALTPPVIPVLGLLSAHSEKNVIERKMAVVAVQEVEQRHSVKAGCVCIPGLTLAVLVQNCCQSVLARRRANE